MQGISTRHYGYNVDQAGVHSTQLQDKIKVTGSDCDGEALTVVCVNEDGIIIVTVF